MVIGTVRAVFRLEIFARSMMLAAQLFTAIFPLLIMVAVLLGQETDDRIAQLLDIPDAAVRSSAKRSAAVDSVPSACSGVW